MLLFKNLLLFYLKQMVKSLHYIGTFLFMAVMLIVRFIIKINEPFEYMNYGDFVGEMMIIIQAVILLIIVYFYKSFSDEFRFGAAKLMSGFFRVTLFKIASLFVVHSLLAALFVGMQIGLVMMYFHFSGIPLSSFYSQTALFIIVYWYLPLLLAFAIGIFTALLFGKNKLGLVFMILCWIAIGPANTTFFYQYFQYISYSDLESLFYIGPLSSENAFNDLIGYNVTYAALLKIVFWILLFLGLVLIVLLRTTRTPKEKGILISLFLFFIGVNVFFFPQLFTNGKAAFDFASREVEVLYYKENTATLLPAQLQYEVVGYEIELVISDIVKAETTMNFTDIETQTIGVALFHGFKVESITDQQGKKLSFTEQGDFILIQRVSEEPSDKLTFSYTMKETTLLPVSKDYLFLPNSVSWIPAKSAHPSFQVETILNEGVKISANQSDEAILYTLSVKGKHPIYTNLPPNEEGGYSGESAGGLTVLSGMLKEQRIGERTVLYPNSWQDISEEWVVFEEVLTDVNMTLNEMFQLDKPLPDQIVLMSFKRDAYTSFQNTHQLLYISGSEMNLSSQTNEIPSIYIDAVLWNSGDRAPIDDEQIFVFNEFLTGYIHQEIKIESPYPYIINGTPLYLGYERNDRETQELIQRFYQGFYDLEKENQKEFLVLWYKKMNQAAGSWQETEQLLQEFKESVK
ncbi:hypothetical protein AC739_00135 [Planococcus glaciei]|uniref:ABC transporter permease n=1 Tax=Planococcus glaciei TaxID=459472 RepID=UPI00069F69BC|nr:ABC transporter permease [Planococcus glaciei]KOF11963.1 hypothetical protein AC739_00135 [Planococcus glaciei]